MKDSPFEILGVPRAVVEHEQSTDSTLNLLKIAERLLAAYSRFYHPDVNPDAGGVFVSMTEALQELRTPGALEYAVRDYLEVVDRAEMIRRRDSNQAVAAERQSLAAVLELLANTSQFRVVGTNQPASFILQLGSARTFLDVMADDRTYLGVSATNVVEELPEQSEKPEYFEGVWSERYLDSDGTLSRFVHRPTRIGKVDIVGYVPATAFRYSTEEDVSMYVEDFSELGEASSAVHVRPLWTSPETAWYLPRLVGKSTEGASVVVRRANGDLAIAGTVQSRAYLQVSFSK